MVLPLLFTSRKKRRIPLIYGSGGNYNATGLDTTPYSFANPALAKINLRRVFIQGRNADTPAAAPTNGAEADDVIAGYVQRFGSGTNSNYTLSVVNHLLTAADITAGNIQIPTHYQQQSIASLLLWNCVDLVWSPTPWGSGATATTGFNRSADNLQTSIAAVSMTADADRDALAICVLGLAAGEQIITAPSTWIKIVEIKAGTAGVNRNGITIAAKTLRRGQASGTDTWTTTLPNRLTTFTALAYAEAA